MGRRNECGCHRGPQEKVIVYPTETIVNTRTQTRIVKRVFPTEIINVNRTIVRNENFYPVTERTVNETVEETFNCGPDINNPRCRPVQNGNAVAGNVRGPRGDNWLFRL